MFSYFQFYWYEIFLRNSYYFFKKNFFNINYKFKNSKKYTLFFNFNEHQQKFNLATDHYFFKLFNKKLKVKNILKWAPNSKRHFFDLNILKSEDLNSKKNFFLFETRINRQQSTWYRESKLWNLFNLNFIRKEKIYTKLKYSRTPQYDIVSGGSAALFSGFLGFLICEKFGFELLDSGDFYFLFMYIVFFFFLSRLLIKLWRGEKEDWNVLSFKWFLFFFKTLLLLIFNKLKYFR